MSRTSCSIPLRALRRVTLFLVAAAALGFSPGALVAATIYNNRAAFEGALAAFITDNYESPGYESGDGQDTPTFDQHTNASMNAVLSETRYTTTGFTDWNLIFQLDGNNIYCAGCNGSYETDFTATSVGTASGVGGVGLDVVGTAFVFGTHAFVTYGDDSTEDFEVPEDGFWGITSPLSVKKIHFGLANGGTNIDNEVQRMAMDNLTIGSLVPEPGTAGLLCGVLFSASCAAPRRRGR